MIVKKVKSAALTSGKCLENRGLLVLYSKAVKFALNALNEFNSNTNFSPRTTVFFKKNAVTGNSHVRARKYCILYDTYMNSMSRTIENGL